MRTRFDALAATDAKIAMVHNNFPGTVVTHFYGTDLYAAMAVDAFFFYYVDYGT
jgi:hypothetical protein